METWVHENTCVMSDIMKSMSKETSGENDSFLAEKARILSSRHGEFVVVRSRPTKTNLERVGENHCSA